VAPSAATSTDPISEQAATTIRHFVILDFLTVSPSAE
jgi:hypothetical protein